MKIGILTSGGDSPGMNAFIASFVNLSIKEKHDVFAVKFGFQGLIDNNISLLTKKDVDNITHLGGSFIKSFRCPEFQTEKGFQKALRNIEKAKLDLIIIIGGDGSLKGADRLVKSGIKVLFIPGTIDNDVYYTNRSLGFDSAVNCAVEQIDKIKQTMLSLNRVFICEVMGRDCADIAKSCAMATNATVLIAEEKDNNFSEILKKIKFAIKNGEESPLIVLKENVLNVNSLAKDLQNALDIETRASVLGYVQRGTSPSVFDRIYANQLAEAALSSIKKDKYNLSFGVMNNRIFSIDISKAVSITSRIE